MSNSDKARPAKKARIAFYTNESFYEDDRHTGDSYWVVKITENEPGYIRYMNYNTLEKAQGVVRIRNAANGINEKDKMDIVASSMRAGEVKK